MVLHRGLILTGLILLMGLLALGCATYKVTTPLSQMLDADAGWQIGEIRDALPSDMDPEDRPATYDFTLLRAFLTAELQKRNLFREVGLPAVDELEVTGTLLEFKRGNPLLGILGGIFGGAPTITMELQLVSQKTREVLFAGNFKQTTAVSSESLDDCYERLAIDFANALEKEHNIKVWESGGDTRFWRQPSTGD